MSTSASSVAVLLFSLSATQEARRKPLAGSVARSERVWHSLEQLTLAKIRAAGLPAVVSHELPINHAGTFGTQLRQAAQAVLELGYSSVICIGNDCPALRPSDLTEAAHALQAGAIPVGADARGGVYLTGLNQALLTNAQVLTNLPWQTTELSASLFQFLHQHDQQPVLLSPCRSDWNTCPDVRLSEAVGARTWLRQLAEALRPVTVGPFAARPISILLRSLALAGLRAPPLR
ncbi:DUF2064 domain-containing protein [Fibrella sp. ES10-3-2-2]